MSRKIYEVNHHESSLRGIERIFKFDFDASIRAFKSRLSSKNMKYRIKQKLNN